VSGYALVEAVAFALGFAAVLIGVGQPCPARSTSALDLVRVPSATTATAWPARYAPSSFDRSRASLPLMP
jgi:hypothetical protein